MPNLKQLHLAGTDVTDRALADLSTLTGLEELRLGFTNVGDDGVQHLGGLEHLNSLWLEKTAVTDTGLATLQRLVGLQELNIRVTDVSREAVAKFQVAVPDCDVLG